MDRRTAIQMMMATTLPLSLTARAATPAPDLVAAFISGFPLFEFARTAYSLAGPGGAFPLGRFNQIQHRRTLSDASSRAITATNNDCLVSSARIDLSGGPAVIAIPDIQDRYFSVALMDAFTDNFHFIGTRATKGRGGRFVLVPPGWLGPVPSDCRKIAAPTTDVWMLVRILVGGPGDYDAVHAHQDRLKLIPPALQPSGQLLPVAPADGRDPANFLSVVNAMLARCPASDPRVSRALRHRDTGLMRGVLGAFADLDGALRSAWPAAIDTGVTLLKAPDPRRERRANGWSYSLANTGDYGADDLTRARTALFGLAALPPEEAFYGHALEDAAGMALSGNRAYRLRLPPGGVPAESFWSVTMYQLESDGRLFLVPNPEARYSIGDRTEGLVRNRDGSLDILMQQARPEGAMAANWLPVPSGEFRPLFRAYLARAELRSLRWRLPAIERV